MPPAFLPPAAKPAPTQAQLRIKKAKELVIALKKARREKREGQRKPDAVVAPPKETKAPDFPPGLTDQALQTSISQIKRFVNNINQDKYTAFVEAVRRLPVRLSSNNVKELEAELVALKTDLVAISFDSENDAFLRRLRLPYDPATTRLFPRGAETVLEKLDRIWTQHQAAVQVTDSLQLEINETNVVDISGSIVRRLKIQADMLSKLSTLSEIGQESIAREDLRLPAFPNFEAMITFYRSNTRETWENVNQTLGLYDQLLGYQRDLAAGKPAFPGLSFEGLFDWVLLIPLRRSSSLTNALVEEFDVEPKLAADFVREIGDRCLLDIDSVLSGFFNQFGLLLQLTVDYFERELRSGADSLSELGQQCWKNAGLLLTIFTRWSQASFFKTPDRADENTKKRYKNITDLATKAWTGFLNESPAEQSIERLDSMLTSEALNRVTEAMSEEPKIVDAKLSLPEKRQLLVTSTCEHCSFAGDNYCPDCGTVLCSEYCYELHECNSPELTLGLAAEQLKQKCRIDLPLYASRKVLDDQDVSVGPKTGQMLAFEYPVLQATQMHDNSYLFHLATIDCRPSCARLYIRYIRVTVNMLTQLAPTDHLLVLVNGQSFSQQLIGFGRTTEESPRLRARTLLVPAGAQLTSNQETDAAWLHGNVAEIPLRSGANTIRLVLPPVLQPVDRFTKEVTASLELILTD